MKKYVKLDIPKENVVLFDKTKESLEEFVNNFVHGEAYITEDLEE